MKKLEYIIKRSFAVVFLFSIFTSCNKENEPSLSPSPDYGINNAFVLYDEFNQPHFRTIKAITEDDQGNIWFGGGEIIVKYDGTNFENITDKFDFDFINIECVLKDNDNTVWFGTESGVLKINCDTYAYSVYTEDDGLGCSSVKSIYKDENGNYWFGSYCAKTLTKFDGANWTKIDFPWIESSWIRNIYMDENNNLWCASYDGLFRLKDYNWTKFTTRNFARDVVEYKNEMYVSTMRGVQKFINDTLINVFPELDSADLTCMFIDKSNNLWLANNNDYLNYGLVKYNGETTEKISIKNDMYTNDVITIFEDSNSKLWFGGSGIYTIQN